MFLIAIILSLPQIALAEGPESFNVNETNLPSTTPPSDSPMDLVPPEEPPYEEPAPRAKHVEPEKQSPRFSSEDHQRFLRYLFDLCKADPVAEEAATQLEGRHFTKAGNKLGSLRLMLENYSLLVESGKQTAEVQRLREVFRRDFYELRDAAELSGKPGSQKDARALLSKISAESACQTRSTREGELKVKRKPASGRRRR